MAMNESEETTLVISFPKALLVSALSMVTFVGGCYVIGIPMDDPLLVGFLTVMVVVMTPVFAVGTVFMLGCRVGRAGLRPAAPTFYQVVLRWEDITTVRKEIGGLYYLVRVGGPFGRFCILPSRFLLKHPNSLRELIERYSPVDSLVRRKLAS